MNIKAEAVKLRQDARGMVFEPVDGTVLASMENVHVALSKPGVVRGNHWHRKGTEVLIVLGPAQVVFRDSEGIREVTVEPGEVWRFIVPPGISHAIRNLDTAPSFLLAFNSLPHDPDHPDLVSDILISPD